MSLFMREGLRLLCFSSDTQTSYAGLFIVYIGVCRAFMTAALWMPFMLGRIVVPVILAWKEAVATSGFWMATQPTFNFLLQRTQPSGGVGTTFAAGNWTSSPMTNSTGSARGASSEAWEGLASKIALLPLVQRLAQELETHLSGPGLNDWVALGIGYCESSVLPVVHHAQVQAAFK